MVKNVPPKLYKFQSFESEHSIENLMQSHIWFSKPEGLNDPFDCAVPILFSSTEKEWGKLKDYYFQWLKDSGRSEEIPFRKSQYLPNGKLSQDVKVETDKLLQAKVQLFVHENSSLGVACFTPELKNILMWSHYAARHTGFCLEFDTNYFPFQDQQKLNKVFYSTSYPTYPHVDIVRKPLILGSPLFTKSKDWKYENEWRLIVQEGNSALKYDSKALTAIYFGCWALKDNMEKIVSLPAKSAARLYQMQRSKTEFKLEYVPYQP